MMTNWERLRPVAMPALALCATWMTGCTTYVTTQVTAFSQWSGSDATRTYAFTRSPDQQNSIEQATYEQIVASELDAHSFKQVSEGRAHYFVGLMYSMRGDMVTVTQPAYYANPWPGPYWRPINPWLGPYNYSSAYVSESYPVYTHTLGIRITERESGEEVYQVTANNTTEDPSLVGAMPFLARSALTGFPLSNGVVRTVRIPADGSGAPNEVTVKQPPTAVPALKAGSAGSAGTTAASPQ